MSRTVDNKLHQGSQFVQLIYVLRDARNKAGNISGMMANLTQDQLNTYFALNDDTGVPVTITAAQTLLSNAAAALNDPAITALCEDVVF